MQLPSRDTVKRLLKSGGLPSHTRVSALVVGATTTLTVVAAVIWDWLLPGVPFPITPDAVLKLVLSCFHVFESAHLVAKLLGVVLLAIFALLRDSRPQDNRDDATSEVVPPKGRFKGAKAAARTNGRSRRGSRRRS